MNRYVIAELGSPPRAIGSEIGPLKEQHREWIQAPTQWSMFLYLHSGVAFVNVQAVPYSEGDLLLFSPGSRVAHPGFGQNCDFRRLSFELEGSGKRMALPLQTKLQPDLQTMFKSAESDVGHQTTHALAFAWALLWHIAEPESKYRAKSELYEAEEWVRRNLDRLFSVPELASSVGIPERTLARMFKEEHGIGVATYVRQRRVREAVRLLVGTDLSLKKVANKIGITNPQQFYNLIRETVGISPSEVRTRKDGNLLGP